MSNFGELVSKIVDVDEVCNHDKSEFGNYPCKYHRGNHAIEPMNELLSLIDKTLDEVSYWAENERGSISEEIYKVCEDIREKIVYIEGRDDIAKHEVVKK